jgi:uncharacterized protein YndB with AHSA1/START domain
MKFTDLKFSRLIPGPASEVFDVWFDPKSPGGPWHDAKKVLMNVAVDGMFYFGMERDEGLLGHFGRFTAIDRPHSAEHTWMSEYTHGIETTVSVLFEPVKGGTQMTLVHRGVPDDEMGREHDRGWKSLISRFERQFKGKR